MTVPADPAVARARVVRLLVVAVGLFFVIVGILGALGAVDAANRASACLAGGCLLPVPGGGTGYWQAQLDTYRGQTTVYAIVAILGGICALAPFVPGFRRRGPSPKPPGP